MTEVATDPLDRAYRFLVDEEDARVCKDIPDESCRVVPQNFFRVLAASTCSKIGDEFCNAKTVLPWLLTFVQAPVFLLGLLVPIRESGSLLPQLVIAAWVRKMARRKWAWVAGSVVQAVMVLMMVLAALALEGAAAGYAIVAALVVFSLGRGFCSVAHKDVIGKTVPKTRRGRLNGVAGSIAGAVAMASGLLFWVFGFDQVELTVVAALLGAAAVSWLVGAFIFAGVDEAAGETSGGGNALEHALSSLGLLRDDGDFRRFVIARALLIGSALLAPYLVQMANGGGEQGIGVLGMFIIANGLAATLSSHVWGKASDTSSRRVMIRAALIAAAVGIFVLVVAVAAPALGRSPWTYALAFLVLGVAHSGVRIGRKTYLVDLSGGQKRTDYVAVSNSVIGVLLLLMGLVSGAISLLSVEWAVLVLTISCLAGAWMSARLPEAQ